ncbi:pyruvate kinase [Allorhodopirellula solitaria]|uniref:Uncharacterized protein n=1 Tax=Allorhodopirellula solitaria TaxID=2527987 RepID=A0A5C5XNE3_9BACT|nr:pyruvate kinase [Allorhodopirellula solitaria]TWT64687.1 hypothetical protein CA85_38200 [Allorhodopirellula solitaria]
MRSFATVGAHRLAVLSFGTLLVAVAAMPSAMADPASRPAATRLSFQRQPLATIPPGTQIENQSPPGWSNLLSFVRVQLTGGDVASISDTVRYYAEFFNLAMLANTQQGPDGRFVLDKVAIGFSMAIKGKNTVITPDTESELGGNLSLIGRGVLEGNVASLKRIEQVARTSHSMLVDAPAVFLIGGEHREMIVRHYIWVFPKNGNVGTLVWLIDPSPRGAPAGPGMKLADTTAQLLPPNMHEDRVMDVDADKFSVFGIPAKDAFASVELPQGRPFEMQESMQRIAVERTYTAGTFEELTAAVAHMLTQAK